MKKFKRVDVSDARLIAGIGGLVIIDVFVVILWTFIDPMSSTVTTLSTKHSENENGQEIQVTTTIPVCTSEYTIVWLIVMYATKGSLLIFGVFLAYETRNVEISALNDSKQIALSVYTVAMTCALSLPIVYITDYSVQYRVPITELFIIAATTIVLGLVFIPKMRLLHQMPQKRINTNTVRQRCNTDPGKSVLESLKKKINEREDELKKLRYYRRRTNLRGRRMEFDDHNVEMLAFQHYTSACSTDPS
ncbi:gamma-aminobutyric acid type B receptor subunit 2-like [Glandiceps talaboti]